MKKRLYKSFLWLLGALGISSCSSGCIPVLYGPGPNADFKVSGRVTNPQGESIPGIQVTSVLGFKASDEDPTEYYPMSKSVETDEKGRFDLTFSFYDIDDYKLKVEDVDGKENGLFKPAMVDIEFVKVDEGRAKWDNGTYEARDVNIVLTPASPSSEEE